MKSSLKPGLLLILFLTGIVAFRAESGNGVNPCDPGFPLPEVSPAAPVCAPPPAPEAATGKDAKTKADPAKPEKASEDEICQLFRQGEGLFFEKKDELARLVFEKILRERPDHPLVGDNQFNQYLADIYLRRGEPARARTHLTIVLYSATEREPVYFRLGQTYFREQKGARARVCFERLTAGTGEKKTEPISVYAWWYAGLSQLFYEREPEGARAKLEKFVELAGPKDPQVAPVQAILKLLEKKECQEIPDLAKKAPGLSVKQFLADNCKLPPPPPMSAPQAGNPVPGALPVPVPGGQTGAATPSTPTTGAQSSPIGTTTAGSTGDAAAGQKKTLPAPDAKLPNAGDNMLLDDGL